MKELLEKNAKKIKKADYSYQAFEDLYYMCREAMKTDTALGVEYLKWLSSECEKAVRYIKTNPSIFQIGNMFGFALFGGAGENRTPVRKHINRNFSGRRLLFRRYAIFLPRTQAVTRSGWVASLYMARAKLTALTFTTG